MAERTELGRRIAAACAMKGISMTALADRIGVARNTLSRIVTGETADPASGIMVKIAKELGISLDFLFGLSEDLNASELEPTAVALVGA
jgi:transcriptional regulator with XRE-family HTH domain